jgi:hypothetical protein
VVGRLHRSHRRGPWICGHDLSDPDTSFNLQLAIRVWHTPTALRAANRQPRVHVMSQPAARRDRDRIADRTVPAIVTALERHRAVTASRLDRLVSLVEVGGSAAEHLAGPLSSLLPA